MDWFDEAAESYGDVGFFTVPEISLLTGWSHSTVQKLFNDPEFPAADFGKCKVVEKHALIDYFSVRHEKKNDAHWQQN